MFPEIDETGSVLGREHISRGPRDENLSAMPCRHDPSGSVEGRAEVVAVPLVCDSCVETHTDEDFFDLPWLTGQSLLHGDRRAEGVMRIAERRRKRIAGGREHVPVAVLDRRVQDLVVARHHPAHGIGVGFPQAGGSLDVGEQECHRPRWLAGHAKQRTDQRLRVSYGSIAARPRMPPGEEGWRSFANAFASIWRMRSRVSSNS